MQNVQFQANSHTSEQALDEVETTDQSDRCLWIHHFKDAILSHTLMQEGINLLSWTLFDESKCPGYLNFL